MKSSPQPSCFKAKFLIEFLFRVLPHLVALLIGVFLVWTSDLSELHVHFRSMETKN